ncbi:MAG TPA: hypothetical protein VF905_09490 [Nitrospirota bacterium]
MLQLVMPLVSGFIGRTVGKSGAEAESVEKLELMKQLINLTPDQAKAVDALKTQPIEEVRTRHALGIGPLAPLPPNANQHAQEIRNAKIAAAAQNVTISAADQAKVANAANPQAAMDAIVNQKVSEIVTSLR